MPTQVNPTRPYRGASNAVALLEGEHDEINSRKVLDLGNISGAVVIDLSAAEIFTAVLIGNVSFSFTNPPPNGWCRDVELRLSQDATGGWAATWPVLGKWPGGTPFVLTTTPNALDYVGMAVMANETWTGYPVEGVA